MQGDDGHPDLKPVTDTFPYYREIDNYERIPGTRTFRLVSKTQIAPDGSRRVVPVKLKRS
jgi:hypothetical protein